MSGIPESAWPEGAVLHSVYTFDGQTKGRWHFLIDTDALPGVSNWCECGSKTAPSFDLAPGTRTARHAAELESLRAEVASRSYGDAQAMAESLFIHIRHGDEQHQEWLRKESVAWAAQWVGVDAEVLQLFQSRVQPWMMECFGPEISADTEERNHRFLEESLELVQACGCTREEALQLVDYVFSRPIGDKAQEVGGVMVTLAALCLAQGLDMHQCAENELARIWTMVESIRAKQASKPKHSPLPQITT